MEPKQACASDATSCRAYAVRGEKIPGDGYRAVPGGRPRTARLATLNVSPFRRSHSVRPPLRRAPGPAT